jgi:hypothetical protein
VSDDEKLIHLTVSEIMALVEILDKEREWTRMLIDQQPEASLENVERQAHIKKLDVLSSRLRTQIG